MKMLCRVLVLAALGLGCGAVARAQAPSVNATGKIGAGESCTAAGSDFGFEVTCAPGSGITIASGDLLLQITYYGMHGTGVMYCAQPAPINSGAVYPTFQLSAASNTTLSVYASSAITTNASNFVLDFVCHQ